MLKFQKNNNAIKELEDYAKKAGKPLKEILRSDEHLDSVSEIFYKSMPRMVKMVMKEPVFKEYYRNNREVFINKAGLN